MRKISLATLAVFVATLVGPGAPQARADQGASGCVPTGELRGDATRGADLHVQYCAECHGADGRAEVIVMHMDVPPKDQTDPDYMRTLTDEFLYLAICGGGTAVGRDFIMPGWAGTLTDQDIRDLVARVREFSGT